MNETFGIGIGEIFSRGLKGYTSNPLPITVAGMLVLALYAAFRVPAQALLDDDRLFESLAVDVIGLIASGHDLAQPRFQPGFGVGVFGEDQ